MAWPDADVAVIGGGPAGIAAALGLLAQGLRVSLFDQGLAASPRIESLPANGIALAEDLQLAPALARAGMGRARAMHLHWRAAPEQRDFGSHAPLLLDRAAFHAGLRDLLPRSSLLAQRVTGLESAEGHVRVHTRAGPLAARFVIDARGRRASRRAHSLGPAMVALGFTGRAGGQQPSPAMLLQALADGWLWAALLPGTHVSGALFLPAAALVGLRRDARASCLAAHLSATALGLPAQLAMGPVSPSGLHAVESPFRAANILSVGDAALAHDPLASHGLVNAMRSGVQAAAAAATILDPGGDGGAARHFIAERHAEAVQGAKRGLSQSLAAQEHVRGGLWAEIGEPHGAAEERGAMPWPTLSRPLALAALGRTAVLEAGRVRWAKALWLQRSGRWAPRLGPLAADRLAALLHPPAPITTLTARLAGATGAPLAQSVLHLLLSEGALREAGSVQPPRAAASKA